MKKAILSLIITMLTLFGASHAQTQQASPATSPLGSWQLVSHHMQIETAASSTQRIYSYEFDKMTYQFLASGQGWEITKYDPADPSSVEKRAIKWKANGNKLTVNYKDATEDDIDLFDNLTFSIQGQNMTIKGSSKDGDELVTEQYNLKKK